MAYDICEHNAALEYIETQMARRGITQELIGEEGEGRGHPGAGRVEGVS